MLRACLLIVAIVAGGVGASAETVPPPAPTDKEVIDNPIAKPGPRYPDPAVDALIEGVVLMRVVIDLDGNVASARVIKAEPAGWFEEAALAAVRQWKYKPAGREVAFDVEMKFELPAEFKEKMRSLNGGGA